MRKIKIVSDSACDIFSLAHTDFASAPLKVITAEGEFIDTADLHVADMVQFMAKYKGKSQSSCPNTNDWLSAFGDADDIFCTTITSGLSGSYNSACVAKQLFESENEGKRVFVVDSLSAGPEITLLAEKLDACVASGMPYEEICDTITAYQKKTGLAFMLRSVKTLANNGRISPLIAKAIGLLGICIVGKASDKGTLQPLHKCRGEHRSLSTLVEVLEAEGWRGGRVSIGHCQNEAAAQQLQAMLLAKHPDAAIEIHALGGLCSFYAEMGGVLVGFEKA